MNIKDINIIKYLGEGTFSKTYLCEKNNTIMAVKIFKPKETSKKNIKYINYEADILKRFKQSQYIVNVYDVHVELYSSYITFEPLKQSLNEFINYYKKIDEYIPLTTIKCISRQILYGLIELKNNGILHADLKPENILFQNELEIKIIDLGNALKEKDFPTSLQSIQTRHYRPPECIIKAPFDYSADMWAFACIVFEMLTNTLLFSPESDSKMTTNSCHLGMFIKTFGDIPIEFLKTGTASHRYIDLTNNIHKFSYLIGKKYSLYKIFRDFGYSKTRSLEFEEFLMNIFVYELEKRITPEDCLSLKFLN